jgi:hypothetical protein
MFPILLLCLLLLALEGGRATETQALPPSDLVLSVPGELQCDEDGSLDVHSIRVDDYDARDFFGYQLAANLTVGAEGGRVWLHNLRGVRVTRGDVLSPSGAQEMHLSGPLLDVQRALAGLTYTPAPHFSGTDSLTVSVRDSRVEGGRRVQGAAAVSKQALIQVLPRNHAPVLAAPSRLSCQEGGSASFSVSMADDDSLSTEEYELLFAADHGSLSFPALGEEEGGAGAVAGDDTVLLPCAGGDLQFQSCQLVGNLSRVTEALSLLRYTPPPHFNKAVDGVALLSVTVRDGDLTSSARVLAVVDPVNDAPELSCHTGDSFAYQAPVSADEHFSDSLQTLFGLAAPISVQEYDAYDVLTVQLQASHGTLSFSRTLPRALTVLLLRRGPGLSVGVSARQSAARGRLCVDSNPRSHGAAPAAVGPPRQPVGRRGLAAASARSAGAAAPPAARLRGARGAGRVGGALHLLAAGVSVHRGGSRLLHLLLGGEAAAAQHPLHPGRHH